VSPTILDEIVAWKRTEVANQKRIRPLDEVREELAGLPPPRDLGWALRPGASANGHHVRLIAEIKRASPSKGPLRPDLDAVALAAEYEAHGAAAISVLTDGRFFQGSLDDLRAVRQRVELPILRKDFVVDPYQLYEARAAGADAVLLIVAALADGNLGALHRLAGDLGLAALVEVHDAAELVRALKIGPRFVGVNNRDLRTFEVNLDTTLRLRSLVPGGVILVAESGVHRRADVERLAAAGVDAVLVGEALVRAENAGRQIRELVG
jgi:indole-3-glycerol phosphate synthase